MRTSAPLLHLNQLAPDFQACDLDGRDVRLSDYRERRLVTLVLTSTFACHYCRGQLTELRDAYAQFRAAGSEIVVVGPDPKPLWHTMFRHHHLPFVGIADQDRRIARLYGQDRRMAGLIWLPAVFLIDLGGRLRYARFGASIRDTPIAATLLQELRRIGADVPESGEANVAATRRELLGAGAEAFCNWRPSSWDEYWRQGQAAGATPEEWIAAILAVMSGRIVAEQVADTLLRGTWRNAARPDSASGDIERIFAELADLDGVQEQIVLLVRLLEIKDPYTAGHSERVAAMATRIATRMELTVDDVEDVALAGLLHDTGKVVVPSRVLAKPGQLNEEEWALMRTHPMAGADLLERLTPFARLAPAVRHHHEQWAGGGYPDGLSGTRIPLAARVLAVCDAFDALTSSRAYRAAMPYEKALAIMRENARGQWQPSLVGLLQAVVHDGGAAAVLSGLPAARPADAGGPALPE